MRSRSLFITIVILSLNTSFYSDAFSVHGELHERPEYNNNNKQHITAEQAKTYHQNNKNPHKPIQEEVLPLSPKEQDRKDLKRAAVGAAIGGGVATVTWGGAYACYVKYTIATGTSISCPPLGALVCTGIVLGALYGYGTSK